MASLKFALLICLFGSALTSAVEFNGIQEDQDALKSGNWFHNLTLQKTQNGDVCQNCTEIFVHLAEVFSNADLQEEIFNGKLCDDLTAPPSVSKICKGEVRKMLPLAFNLIFASMELRGSSIELHTKPFDHVPESHDLFISEFKKPIPCFICKAVMTIIVNLLPTDRTVDSVVKVLAHVCHVMPPFLKNKCSSLLEQFGAEILELLLTYKAPKVICKAIRLC